jgi:hypothetical protein
MSKLHGVLSLAIVFLFGALVHASDPPVHKPKEGYVPDERTAIRIAEAILVPIYGAEQIKSELPLSAKLRDDVWVVTGNLPAGADGGVAEVRISKRTGEILGVTHGK